jgi:hypothetical protein
MQRESFPGGVAEQLKWYVYRLIDPRNGETFYVGKGQGNRIFTHAKGILNAEDEEIADPKIQRIKEISAAGLEVGHVIHRHGIETARIAHEVEAALIDAYPGLENKVRGHGSKDYGSRHVEQIIEEYNAEPFVVIEPLLLISIGRMYYQRRSVYDAVRCAWKIDTKRAGQRLVLAVLRGLVVGAYQPSKWIPATLKNFPDMEVHPDMPDRWGFVGNDAEDVVWQQYVRKRVPERYRPRGAQNPIRYCDPDEA